MKTLVLPSAYHLARQLRASKIEVQRFPDGEHKLRVPATAIGKSVMLVGTTGPSADDLLDLVFACSTLKELGCRVTLLVTYFAYARQDRPREGEAHGTIAVCRIIKQAGPDKVIIVNPHSNVIVNCLRPSVIEALPCLVAALPRNALRNAVIVGPDADALLLARHVARRTNLPALCLKKKRITPTKVATQAPHASLAGKNVILVDDIVSTGATLIEAAKAVRKAGAAAVYVAVCHNVAGKRLGSIAKKIRAKKMVVSDTLPSKFCYPVLSKLI
jgi:ribose-phosphate pyrophosphokinase